MGKNIYYDILSFELKCNCNDFFINQKNKD